MQVPAQMHTARLLLLLALRVHARACVKPAICTGSASRSNEASKHARYQNVTKKMRKKPRLKQNEARKKRESTERGSRPAGRLSLVRPTGWPGRAQTAPPFSKAGKAHEAARGRTGPVRCQPTGRRAPSGETPSTGLGHPQTGTALAGTLALGAQRTACPALWGRGVRRLAVLTTSTVPPIKMNSFVMISTISRTCEGSAQSVMLVQPDGETPAPKQRLHPRGAA